MIVIIYVKMLTNMTDKAGDNAKKKLDATVIPTAPATSLMDACLSMRIEEDKLHRIHGRQIALHQWMVDMAIWDYRALTMVKCSNSHDSPMAPFCGYECFQASSHP